jgi:hypothetical protein
MLLDRSASSSVSGCILPSLFVDHSIAGLNGAVQCEALELNEASFIEDCVGGAVEIDDGRGELVRADLVARVP